MDINASIVRSERHARSWTQQHLADACNLSLRTVQRVERFGSAAPDTVMELCAVLEVTQDQLVVPSVAEQASQSAVSPTMIVVAMGAALLFGVGVGAAVMYSLLQ